jgi:hypothetical protein
MSSYGLVDGTPTGDPPPPESRYLIITGSRDWNDYQGERDESIWAYLQRFAPDTIVVHGGARGADFFAGKAARELGLEVIEVPADWAKHGRAAGPIRNQLMLDRYPPFRVGAFRAREHSIGTNDCIRRAAKLYVPIDIHTRLPDGRLKRETYHHQPGVQLRFFREGM